MEFQPLKRGFKPSSPSISYSKRVGTKDRANSPVLTNSPSPQLYPSQTYRSQIQTKINVGAPNDRYENEADRVADRIMGNRGHTSASPSVTPILGNSLLQRTSYSPYSIDEGKTEGEPFTIQAKSDRGGIARPSAEQKVQSVLKTPGSPLPGQIRNFMETRFGYDFGHVRIHSNTNADKAARSVNARAFTKDSSIVFANGQYAPQSPSGKWLLAHELTHVVQQGASKKNPDLQRKCSSCIPDIEKDSEPSTLRRVKWSTAVDTNQDSQPWGSGPNGDVYQVETDAGRTINAWKPHDGTTYWCHGFTFGGSSASNGPFSIWGSDVPTVLTDDGWSMGSNYSCISQPGDILVFAGNNVAHTGIIQSTSAPAGIVDENASMLDSKWGQQPQNVSSWAVNAAQYGNYSVYTKAPATGICAGKGPNEN